MKILAVREAVSDLSYKVEKSALKSLLAEPRFLVLFTADLLPFV